jgi:competence protein ComEC
MKNKFLLYVAVAVLFLGFSSHVQAPTVSPWEASSSSMSLYLVDVGMGDAIFIDIPPNHSMLVDAGSWDNSGIQNLMEFLDDFYSDPSHGAYRNTIDVVVASHQHKDHIQGMLNVLAKYTVTTYFDNGVGCAVDKEGATALVKQIEDLLVAKSIKHEQLTETLIRTNGTNGVYTDKLLDPFETVDVVALDATPDPPDTKENDNSIVLKVTCGQTSFLLMGDAEVKEETRLMKRLKDVNGLAILRCDVLKAGHHGSNTASSEAFVKAVNPGISLVSVGLAAMSPKTKSFRLPKESVMKRLDKLTGHSLKERWEAQMFPDKKPKSGKGEKPKVFKSFKEIYVTSSDGTVFLKSDGKKIDAGSLDEMN